MRWTLRGQQLRVRVKNLSTEVIGEGFIAVNLFTRLCAQNVILILIFIRHYIKKFAAFAYICAAVQCVHGT